MTKSYGLSMLQAIPTLAATLVTLTTTSAMSNSKSIAHASEGQAAQPRSEGAVPLPLVLQLAGSYEKLGHHEEALNLYLRVRCVWVFGCSSVIILSDGGQEGRICVTFGRHVQIWVKNRYLEF